MKIKKLVAIVVLSSVNILVSNVYAASGTGKVSEIVYYGSGSVLIKGVNFGSSTGCQYGNGFYLSANHPQFNGLYSSILSAKV